MKQISSLHQTWVTILSAISGLIWKVANYTARKHSQAKPSPVCGSEQADRSEASSVTTLPTISQCGVTKDSETILDEADR